MTISKKFLFLILGFTILLSPKRSLSFGAEETIFSKISGQYSRATAKPNLTKEEFASVISQENGEQQVDKEKIRQILLKKIALHKNKEIVFDLFHHNQLAKDYKDQQDGKTFPNATLTSEQFWQNIELYCGQNTSYFNLISTINRTKSASGNAMLAKMLAQPTTDISELLKTQTIVKELLANKELREDLEKIVNDFVKVEADLLSFWDEQALNSLFSFDFYYPPEPFGSLPDNILNKVFPRKARNFLNSSPKSLEALNLMNNLTSVKMFMHQIENSGLLRIVRFMNNKVGFGSASMNNYLNRKINFDNFSKAGADWEDLRDSWKNCHSFWDSLGFFWAFDSFAFDAVEIPAGIISVFKTAKSEISKIKILKTAYGKLVSAATSINKVVELKEKIDSNHVLKNNLVDCFDPISYLFEKKSSNSKKFDNMLTLIQSDTFKDLGLTDYINVRGKVLATSYLMIRTQNRLADVLQAIGQIDAYLSIAELFLESENKNAKYCFVKYLDQETPYVYLENFWPTMINQDKVITNNIELGKSEENRDGMISGPNAGGKSTILKAIIINILFAQTLGISASSVANITPFIYLDTYLNIVDDLAAGNSLFKAEVARTKELLETLKILFPKKCFVIMDEIFSGTNPKEGEAAGYAVGKYLSTMKNTITLISSHFPKMTYLEENTTGIFKNYKVSVIQNEDKTLSYPFKLERGKTNQTIAINILEAEKFDPQIIKDAREIIVAAN